MDGIPHERSLVEKFKGRPFAMIGINFGEDGGNVAAAEKKFGVTWRSFSHLGDFQEPDVSYDLDLQAAGYIMLVDSRGIIRYKGSESAFLSQLDSELEALVQEAEDAEETQKAADPAAQKSSESHADAENGPSE